MLPKKMVLCFSIEVEKREDLKSLLMKLIEESEKQNKTKKQTKKTPGLKLNIQKTKIVATSPITSWQIDGETMETVRDLIFLLSKITADGACSHEIKRCLLFGKKAMTNLDSILKSRDIFLHPTKWMHPLHPTKVRLVKAMFFSQWSCMDVRVGL